MIEREKTHTHTILNTKNQQKNQQKKHTKIKYIIWNNNDKTKKHISIHATHTCTRAYDTRHTHTHKHTRVNESHWYYYAFDNKSASGLTHLRSFCVCVFRLCTFLFYSRWVPRPPANPYIHSYININIFIRKRRHTQQKNNYKNHRTKTY